MRHPLPRLRPVLLWTQGHRGLPPRWRPALLRAAGVAVGPDTRVDADLQVTGPARISLGAGTYVNTGVRVEAQAPVRIGERVSLAQGVRILTSTHLTGDRSRRAGPLRRRPVEVGDGCWLGAGATLLPGVRVAAGCVVAAGAVVVRDTDPDGLYAGVPATRVRDL